MQTARGASLNGAADTIPGRHRKVRVVLLVAAVVVALDQAAKILAVAHLSDGRTVSVIGDFLQLRLIRNSGAAFGIATDLTIVFTLVAMVVVVFILRMSRRLTSLPWAIALGGFLGGALGNLTDRIFRAPSPLEGHVIDFLELPNWPIFNLADSAIVGAAVLVAVLSLRGVPLEEPGDREADDATLEPDDLPREQ